MSSRQGVQKPSSQGQSYLKPAPSWPGPGFLVKIEEIKPDYRKQPPQSQNHPCGFFFPPNQSDALTTGSKYLFRYRDPVFREVAPSDPVRGQLTEPYGAATVFSQATDTAHLLAVPFDARTRDIRGTDYNWRCLGFEHIPVQNRGTGTYASLDFVGEKKCLPAVVSAWKKLIPPPYRYQQTDDNGNPIPSETTCAGLIGSLPLLVALAAFSAQPSELPNALTTSRSTTGHWVPHSYNTGRTPERGLVVTIYRDPENTAGSTKTILENLENGTYGAFYAP